MRRRIWPAGPTRPRWISIRQNSGNFILICSSRSLPMPGRSLRSFCTREIRFNSRINAAWDARCSDWKTRYPVVTEEHRKPESLVSIFHLAEVIGTESTPDDLLVSGSSGSGIEIFLLACPTRNGQRIFHTAGLGAMGYGLPMSVGVCIGGGSRRTILVDGDGGFQFNIQELETVSRLKLPIKFFILNNDGYASIRASQTAYFGKPNIGCDSRTGMTVPDLSRIAAAYNIPSVVIQNQRELRARRKTRLGDGWPSGDRRARDSGRNARSAAAIVSEAGWFIRIQAAGGYVPIPSARGVSGQHDCQAAGRVSDRKCHK